MAVAGAAILVVLDDKVLDEGWQLRLAHVKVLALPDINRKYDETL